MGKNSQNQQPPLPKPVLRRHPVSDRLFQRLHLLAEPQRSVLEMYCLQNYPIRLIARTLGVHIQTARRNIRDWTERLLGEDYLAFCRNRLLFSEEQMAVAYQRFILAAGYRSIARRLGQSHWRIRKMVRKLECWLSEYKENHLP